MNKLLILALVMTAAFGATITNQVAYQCISEVTVPDQLSFTFDYAVQCNQFHNGLVNSSTSQSPVDSSAWKKCQTSLKSVKGVSSTVFNGFVNSINSCITKGTATLQAAAISNKVAFECVSSVELPQELSFAFNYGVDCNRFHNGMVNESTLNNSVNVSDWKTCRDILSEHFTDDEATQFYAAIDSCVSTGKPAVSLMASAVTNAVAEACVEKVTLPDELSFAFNYGVDCNKFHNGLVNASTSNQPVTVANWTTCKNILKAHFTDADAKTFYTNIDQCVATGKAPASLSASNTVSNKVAFDCISKLTIPQEVTFAFNYGVDCNKFHNGLVNESTQNDPVTVANWATCKEILAEHFTDDEAKTFYSNIDQCVAIGKAPVSLSASAVTNAVAEACVEKVTLPDELSFAFNYGVDCNKFHNGLVNASTANKPVTVANWTTCKNILSSHFTDADAKAFYSAIDSCVSTGKPTISLMASAVSNAVAEACVEKVTLPDELSFAFNYGVDCNKFHNGLVNASTANQPVTVANWTTCKNILKAHFTDADAKTFYANIDQCVATGKAPASLSASAVTNAVAEACVETVTLPDELSFAFNYGVDCNKFHNGLVNASTANKPVTVANWTTCKNILSSHFTDADAKAFYANIDSCVASGKKVSTFLKSYNEESLLSKIFSFFNQL